MGSASDIGRLAAKLILVMFMVIHAPIIGVMTAANAVPNSDPLGAGVMVICLDGNFAEIETPGGPHPGGMGAHECLCPCGTLGAKSALDIRPLPYVLIFQDRDLGRVDWVADAGPVLTPPPQTGRGSPRAPPFSQI